MAKRRKRSKKISKRVKLLFTILFITVFALAAILFVVTIDETDQVEIRTVPHTISLDEIVDGGPPKDGIPAVDNPLYLSVDEAKPVMNLDEEVLIIQTKKDIRIVPLKILLWHHIINDVTSDPPLVITYDPFTDHAAVFNSVYNGQLFNFGVSGKLYESNMLMYDRATNSLWQQYIGQGVVGEMTNAALGEVSSHLIPWKYAKKKYTDAIVLSRDTGFVRDYDEPVYDAYRASDKLFFEISYIDERLPLKETVYGVRVGDSSKAYTDLNLDNKWLLEDPDDLLVLKNPQTELVRVFKPYIWGRLLNFEIREDGIYDLVSESKWNFDGECEDGQYKGWSLTEVPVKKSYWFAWSAFNHDSLLYKESSTLK
jgi:hypothetical protein